MSQVGETFFTVIGCMDGRIQEPVAAFGRQKFGYRFPDTITEAGIVGILADNPSQTFLGALKTKILISLEKHHANGILVDGHAECAGDPVDEKTQKEHIRKSVSVVKSFILQRESTPVIGVFVFRSEDGSWKVEEITS